MPRAKKLEKAPDSSPPPLTHEIMVRIVSFVPTIHELHPGITLPLKATSCATKSLRNICLARLFAVPRTMATAGRWKLDNLPSQLWQWVSIIRIALSSTQKSDDVASFSECLLGMSGVCPLREIEVTSGDNHLRVYGLSKLYRTLCEFPTFQVIRLSNLKWSIPEAERFKTSVPTQMVRFEEEKRFHLRHAVFPAWNDGKRNVTVNRQESAALEWLTTTCHSTIRHLALPGRITPITHISTLDWPELLSLKIVGSRPGAEPVDASLLQMLLHAPELESLTICISNGLKDPQKFSVCPASSRPKRIRYPTPKAAVSLDVARIRHKTVSPHTSVRRGTISPRESLTGRPSRHQSLSPRALLPRRVSAASSSVSSFMAGASIRSLRRLSIGNPVVDDELWGILPGELTSLSLLGFPHYMANRHDELYPANKYHLKPLASMELLTLVKKIPSLSSLATLKVSFWATEDDARLLDYVVAQCGSLQTLEVHRNHDTQRSNDLYMIALKLAEIESLRKLYLDFLFEDTYFRMEPGTIADPSLDRERERAALPLFTSKSQERADLIIENVPQLEVLGLAYDKPDQDFHWRIYRPVIDEEGKITVVYDENSKTYLVAEY